MAMSSKLHFIFPSRVVVARGSVSTDVIPRLSTARTKCSSLPPLISPSYHQCQSQKSHSLHNHDHDHPHASAQPRPSLRPVLPPSSARPRCNAHREVESGTTTVGPRDKWGDHKGGTGVVGPVVSPAIPCVLDSNDMTRMQGVSREVKACGDGVEITARSRPFTRRHGNNGWHASEVASRRLIWCLPGSVVFTRLNLPRHPPPPPAVLPGQIHPMEYLSTTTPLHT